MSDGAYWIVMTLSTGVVFGVFLFIARYMHQRHMQRRMQEEVRNIFFEYIPVEPGELEIASKADQLKESLV